MVAKKVAPFLIFISLIATGCSAPLTTRERAAVIGGLGGAAVGGAIGAATGHPGAGAAIGGATGLLGGALIGDDMQRREYHDRYYRR
ncbi:MAG: hypothetical protein HY695_27380 [Deltaproteobacteria bacterium]|nr:hypothetical protein [Deltaproteobacteria bacterium]